MNTINSVHLKKLAHYSVDFSIKLNSFEIVNVSF